VYLYGASVVTGTLYSVSDWRFASALLVPAGEHCFILLIISLFSKQQQKKENRLKIFLAPISCHIHILCRNCLPPWIRSHQCLTSNHRSLSHLHPSNQRLHFHCHSATNQPMAKRHFHQRSVLTQHREHWYLARQFHWYPCFYFFYLIYLPSFCQKYNKKETSLKEKDISVTLPNQALISSVFNMNWVVSNGVNNATVPLYNLAPGQTAGGFYGYPFTKVKQTKTKKQNFFLTKQDTPSLLPLLLELPLRPRYLFSRSTAKLNSNLEYGK
jgi:hypothetical protein